MNNRIRINYTPGMRFGRLVLIERIKKQVSANGSYKLVWLCKCDCGNFKEVTASHLGDGHCKSCGCLNSELSSQRMTNRRLIHGLSTHPIYIAWRHMIDRCYKDYASNYINYGAKGITICDDWFDINNFNNQEKFKNFYNWSIINGWKPNLEIDRIDVNGNYEPSNCRWVTKITQANNKRDTKYIELDGIIYPISILAYILGIDSDYFYNWLYDRGFNINCIIKTIDTPIGLRRYFTDLNGNIIPTNIVYFTLKNREYVSQTDYIDSEPMYLCYNIDKNGFITGPLI